MGEIVVAGIVILAIAVYIALKIYGNGMSR